MKSTHWFSKSAVAILCFCLALALAQGWPAAAAAETPAGYPAVRIDPATGAPYDLGGQTVYIYDFWTGTNWSDITPETEEQQATYNYRRWIENTYNCHIVQAAKGDWGTHTQELTNFVADPDGTLCVYILTPDSVSQVTQNGIIDTWNSNTIDTTDSKWNQASSKLTEKGGTTSTLNPSVSEPRQVIFFNKTLLTQAGIAPQSIYTMQKNNAWTWSAFENIMDQVVSENVAALTGNSDDFYRIAVFANGGSFFDHNSEGSLAITADSAQTIEALSWAKRVWNAYSYKQQENDSWDYYKQAFANGKAAFYISQAYDYSSFSSIDWGCVAFPIGPSSASQDYVTIVSDNVTVLPNVYDESTKAKIALIYDLWTNPTPGYESATTISAGFVEHGDEDAIDTYAMLQNDDHTVVDMTILLGSQNVVTGPGFLWEINTTEDDAATLVENNRSKWQALCDVANGVERLAMPTFENVTHGDTVGQDFSADIVVPEGAAWVYVEFGRVMDDGTFIYGPWDMVVPNSSNTFDVLGINMLEPGTYRLQAQAHINDGWEESPQDSEWAIYDFTLASAQLPDISDKVVLPNLENVSFGDSISYTVSGAEAVVELLGAADGSWGHGIPTNYTAGDSSSFSFNEEPGGTLVTIWARYNGIWSTPYETIFDVQALGDLDMPNLYFNNNRIDTQLTAPVGASLEFNASVNYAASIFYKLSRINDDDNEWIDSDSCEGPYASFTLDLDQLPAGNYLLTVNGYQHGWSYKVKTVQLELRDDTVFASAGSHILGYLGDPAVTELTIPAFIGGQQITAIDDFVLYRLHNLISVTLPGTLTSLGDAALSSSSLTSVLVPDGVDTKTWYFYEADKDFHPYLYSVELPIGITDADQHAPFIFSAIPGITPDFITPTQLTVIEEDAFANTSPTYVWLSNGVKSIGNGAFAGCTDLQFVRIPASCTSIGENAFPAGTVLLVEWGDEAYHYAIENNYEYITLAEGFNG